MKRILSVSVLMVLATICVARPVAYWPYEKLTKEADLTVIATPIRTEDSGEKMNIPGIVRGNDPIPALGVNTTFEVLTVLKGEPDLKNLVLFHLKEVQTQNISLNGPGLVSFDPKGKRRFLLFLKKEADGRFSALTGQTDPEGSVKDLGVHP